MHVDRVVIAHQDDRGRVVLFAEVAHKLQGPGSVWPPQRAQARRLDGGAVGHRVGEGHAEFDHVGAGAWQSLHHRERAFVIGIAGHHEGDQRGAAGGFEGSETGV